MSAAVIDQAPVEPLPSEVSEDGHKQANLNPAQQPQPGVSYPINVFYCGECSMPVEYCEYSGKTEKCRQWLDKNLPQEMSEKLNLSVIGGPEDGAKTVAETSEAADDKKHQKRGGKGSSKSDKAEPKSKAVKPSKITLKTATRSKNKSVTIVKGLGTYGIDMKVASKFFSSRFACGCSVAAADELIIQGDVKDKLFDIIPEKWKQVDEDSIEDVGGD